MADWIQQLMGMSASGDLRGRLSVDAPLKRLTWFRTGGRADVLFEPADMADLKQVMRVVPTDVPITVIGVGSNLLVRDGGVRGLVLRLGRGFADIAVTGSHVEAGAAAMDVHVARTAADAGLTGLEFLVGVPGTIGGALAMNAGAYGGEIADCFVKAEALDRQASVRQLAPGDMAFSYRKSGLAADLLITRVWLKAKAAEPATAQARMAEIVAARGDSQPLGTRTGGSTFKNPQGHKAWELIDAAGCRGLRVGDAQISEKHCNFMLNTGNASAADLEDLGERVRQRVLDHSGITLEWEIRRIGETRP